MMRWKKGERNGEKYGRWEKGIGLQHGSDGKLGGMAALEGWDRWERWEVQTMGRWG